MTKDKSVDLVQQRYNLARENQRSKFEKFNDFDFIYNNELKHYDPQIPSKVFNPIVWSFIETIITRMLAKTPEVAYKPREVGDDTNSSIFTDLFGYWFDKCDIYPKMVQWVKNSLIYGTGIAKVDWYTSKPRIVKSYQFDLDGTPMVDDSGEYLTEETEVVDYDDPRLTPVNIYDFFIDPNATSVDDAAWVVHQYWANLSDLELENAQAAEYGKKIYNKGQLDSIRREKAQNYNEYEERRREAVGFDMTMPKDTTVDRCLIWEMWENDRLIVIADGMKVIRDTKNPYWHGKKPFVHLVDSIVPHEFWGKGEVEPIEKLLYALNTTQNQRITNVNRILDPMWKAKPNVDDYELQFIDNNVIHVNDMDDADFVQMPDVTNGAYQEAEAIKEDMQRALGVTDYVQGVQTPGQTAREVETKTAQANARFAHKVKLFEEMALRQVGTLVYQLYQQYITKERVMRIVGAEGEKYVRFTPQDIVGEYDVIPESQSTLAIDSEAEYEKFANLYNLVQPYIKRDMPSPVPGMPPMSQGFLNDQELVKELFKRSGEKDPDKFFVPEQEMGMPQEGMMNGQVPQDQGSGREAPFLPGLIGDDAIPGLAAVGGQDQIGY